MSCVPFEPDFGCCAEWETLSPELQARALDLAWSTMRSLSGGQVGNCPVTVRPCLSQPCNVCGPWWFDSLGPIQPWVSVGLVAGQWINCACASPECSCERLCEIVMPGAVATITSVLVDGVEQPLDDYRIVNGNRIARVDGQCFPSCQNMNAPLTDVGTVGIEYVPGIVPDAAGLWAAGVLACEFSKACTGNKCRLPSSVTSISRQGVSFTMSAGMFVNGLTGIREVDAYLVAINPAGLARPAIVWSPDVPWAKHRYERPAVLSP